jgi:hypothetical protein
MDNNSDELGEVVSYKDMDHKMGFYCGDDAVKWAAAFQEIVIDGPVEIDEELMIGWFANAIEESHSKRTGYDQILHPTGAGAVSDG